MWGQVGGEHAAGGRPRWGTAARWVPGGRAPRGWGYFTKYQFSGVMLSVGLCGK